MLSPSPLKWRIDMNDQDSPTADSGPQGRASRERHTRYNHSAKGRARHRRYRERLRAAGRCQRCGGHWQEYLAREGRADVYTTCITCRHERNILYGAIGI
jgi:hypothetical protein